MASTWVLVADNSEARVYDFDRHKKTLTLIDEVDHEEGRWKNQAFVSSGPGHTITSSGSHTSRAVGTDASPKTHESHNFAHMIGTSINHAYDLHRFDTYQPCALRPNYWVKFCLKSVRTCRRASTLTKIWSRRATAPLSITSWRRPKPAEPEHGR